MTMQLRQCSRNSVNKESLLWKSGSISFQNRNSQSVVFMATRGPQSLLWVVYKGLSAVDVCDGTSRLLVTQSLPLSLGLKPIITRTDEQVWSCQSVDCVSQQCPVLYITDTGCNLTHLQETKKCLCRNPKVTCLPSASFKKNIQKPFV